MKFKIALAQMDIALGRPHQNLERVKELAHQAADQAADVLVLPELWSTGYALEDAESLATKENEKILADICSLAQRYRLHIAGSTLSLVGEGRFGNTLTWATSEGTIAQTYTKTHLFRLMNEDKFLAAGDRTDLLETPWGQAGLSICYDLRFPELFRKYALGGAQMIFVPAEWPHPRLMHWRTLLRARAIENQLFMIACNRVGREGETSFCGHSAIIDPWGETLVEGGEDECLLTAEIDIAKVDEIRSKIPVFADRRPELYSW